MLHFDPKQTRRRPETSMGGGAGAGIGAPNRRAHAATETAAKGQVAGIGRMRIDEQAIEKSHAASLTKQCPTYPFEPIAKQKSESDNRIYYAVSQLENIHFFSRLGMCG